MKDIQEINKEREVKKVEKEKEYTIKEAISKESTIKEQILLSGRPMSGSSKYEVFTDDQDKSQFSYTLPEDSIADMTESQLLNDAIHILNDPNLSVTLKTQYEKVVQE